MTQRTDMEGKMPTKERVRDVIAEVEELDLPDGAHWMMIHERLGLEYGDVFDFIAQDPDFFGYSDSPTKEEGGAS